MKHEDTHITDQQLLQDIENELSVHDAKLVQDHLDTCWKCRTHRQELETAIADFVRSHQQEFNPKLPPASGPRALLKARLSQLPGGERDGRPDRRFAWALAATAFGLAIFISYVGAPGRTRSRQLSSRFPIPG